MRLSTSGVQRSTCLEGQRTPGGINSSGTVGDAGAAGGCGGSYGGRGGGPCEEGEDLIDLSEAAGVGMRYAFRMIRRSGV